MFCGWITACNFNTYNSQQLYTIFQMSIKETCLKLGVKMLNDNRIIQLFVNLNIDTVN